MIVGDPFQALYGWRGASPDVLAGEIHKVLPVATEENPLALSYRVPRAVHAAALALIKGADTYDERVHHRDVEAAGAAIGRTSRSPLRGR